MEQMHLLFNLNTAGYKISIPSRFWATLLVNHTYYNTIILICFVQIAGGHLYSLLIWQMNSVNNISYGKQRQLLTEICGRAANCKFFSADPFLYIMCFIGLHTNIHLCVHMMYSHF
jgi:hypothetical protein